MTAFIWGKHFETGIESVDQQHQYLVNLVNQLGDHLTSNSVEFEEFENLFSQLMNYTSYHFNDEEQLMEEVGLDARHVDRHKEMHKGFVREVLSIQSLIRQGDTTRAGDLLNYLTHWLAYHILGMDQNMARQVFRTESGIDPISAFELEEKRDDDSTELLLEALDGLFKQVSSRSRPDGTEPEPGTEGGGTHPGVEPR